MKTFVWASFVMQLLRILVFALTIAKSKYPRMPSYSLGSDVVTLLIGFGLFAWTVVLIFR